MTQAHWDQNTLDSSRLGYTVHEQTRMKAASHAKQKTLLIRGICMSLGIGLVKRVSRSVRLSRLSRFNKVSKVGGVERQK